MAETHGIKKYIGTKDFYKATLTVAVPIMIQNFITNFVSMLDNLMVGSLGTEQMSGVAVVNQLLFICNLAIFGALSGAGIFTAQFYGKDDNDGIRYTVRYKILSVTLLVAAFVVLLILFDEPLINLFLHEADESADPLLTLNYGKQYLAVMVWGLIPFAAAQTVSSTLRETGETVAPMAAGFIAVLTNCLFNYILIFGKFGAPALGVVGAATATVISRFVELTIIVVYIIRKRSRFVYIKGLFKSFKIPKPVFKVITVKGMPLLFNEFMWSSGMSLLSVAYSLHGISVVAGYSISSTVMNLSNIVFLSLGSSIGIIVGKLLGAGKFDEAIDTARKLIAFSVTISACISVIVFNLGGLIPCLYNTSAESKEFAAYFIKVSSLVAPIDAFANASYFTIRSGGKTFITFLMDSIFVLAINVPAAFLLYYVFGVSIWVTFPVVNALFLLKVAFGYVLLKKRVWVNNIVTNNE